MEAEKNPEKTLKKPSPASAASVALA